MRSVGRVARVGARQVRRRTRLRRVWPNLPATPARNNQSHMAPEDRSSRRHCLGYERLWSSQPRVSRRAAWVVAAPAPAWPDVVTKVQKRLTEGEPARAHLRDIWVAEVREEGPTFLGASIRPVCLPCLVWPLLLGGRLLHVEGDRP